MNRKELLKLLLPCVVLFGSLAYPVYGQGKAPEKQKAKPAAQEKSLKDDANETLDDLEHGLRKAAKGAKKGANEGLEAIDRGIHKIIEPEPKK
jgi:hypothetical protein